jgi:hypothetical protein
MSDESEELLLTYVESFLSQRSNYVSSMYIAASLGLDERVDQVIKDNLHRFKQKNEHGFITYQIINPPKRFILPEQDCFEEYEYSTEPLEPLKLDE